MLLGRDALPLGKSRQPEHFPEYVLESFSLASLRYAVWFAVTGVIGCIYPDKELFQFFFGVSNHGCVMFMFPEATPRLCPRM
jgi:hypothetical protein